MSQSKLRRTPKVFGTSYRPEASRKNATTGSQLPIQWRPIILVAVVLLVIFGLTRLPVFQIKTATLTGVTNEKLSAEIQGLVGTSIFSRKIGRISEEWLLEDQSLAGLVCRRGIPSTVTCQGTMRNASVIWQIGQVQYLVDQLGRLYAAKGSEGAELPLIEDRTTAEAKLGELVASTEVVGQITILAKLLKDRGVVVNRFFLNDTLYQPGVVISQFKGPGDAVIAREVSVLFMTTESLEAQVKSLDALLKQRGDKVAERIDLRIPGYVFYR